jgi:RNA polymerase sigma factor (sigma-70 family)
VGGASPAARDSEHAGSWRAGVQPVAAALELPAPASPGRTVARRLRRSGWNRSDPATGKRELRAPRWARRGSDIRKAPRVTSQKQTASPHTHDPGDHHADDAAVIRLAWHEPEHFAVLFRRHAPEIQRYVVRRIGTDAADDVVAETFLTAFRQLGQYDLGRPDARPWLYGIATNLIGRHRRSEVRQYRALARTGADPVTEPFTDRVDAIVSANRAARPLAAALARLPAGHRDVLLLMVWGGLTYEQAALALGIPVGTVRSRMHRPGPSSGGH